MWASFNSERYQALQSATKKADKKYGGQALQTYGGQA